MDYPCRVSLCAWRRLPIPYHGLNCCFCYLFPSDCEKMVFHLKIGCVCLFCMLLDKYSLQDLAKISVLCSMCMQNSHES